MSMTSRVFAAALTLLVAGVPASAAKDPADALMKKGLDALKANDYTAFVAAGTARLKGMPKPSFALVSAHFGPMLTKGYKTTYLAQLRKPGQAITLWKLEPANGNEDYEIKIVLEGGKVDVFSIQ